MRLSSGDLEVIRDVLRTWARQAEVDGGKSPRATTNDATRITNMDKSQRTAQGELDPGSGSVFAAELEVIP